MSGYLTLLFAIFQLSLLGFGITQKFDGDSCTTSDQRNGTCRPISQCPFAQEELRSNKRPITCSFEVSNPIVCCPNESDSAIIGSSVRVSDPPMRPGEKAERWCQGYIRLCSRRRLIAGGQRTSPSEFPHMAAIGYGEEDNKEWFCGGTLISNKFVMTAAHCLSSVGTGPARWVLLGTGSLTSGDGQIHPIIRRIPHPEYKPSSKYNDLALLEIGDPIPSNNTDDSIPIIIRPACLPSLSFNHNTSKGIATGWGRTGFADDSSPELLKVDLDILDPSTCNHTFGVEINTTGVLRRGIDDTMLCAGVLQGGKDTCQGDSGGPLLSPRKETCIFVVLGVTSFGKFCALANSPAVYTRVSEYIPWIESVVSP